MKTINANTIKGNALIEAYNRTNYFTLRQCYGRCSWEKERAEADCLKWMREENGHGFRILSFNTFQFSCGWMTAEGLRVETACNSYLVK